MSALVLMSLFANADNLVIQKLDLSEYKQTLDVIGRLEFDLHLTESADESENPNTTVPDLLLISKDNQLLFSIPVDNIQKITLDEIETKLEQSLNSNNFNVIFDNGTIKVEGVESVETIRVFDMNGKLMLSQGGNSISVETLPKGVYILQCGINIVKFTK